ncbi:MAG: hydroxyphenylacetyl-CoA thioesterase PaaI [Chitinophagales bacterium]|nr:hydroxyphenylacetyl-CoA thioesterase PaaI [Chitinophagales bacterium]
MMTPEEKAHIIVHQLMLDKDAFSQWLGIEVLDVRPGYCLLQMTIRSEMLNGFEIAHGGITYSIADSALAFASNSHGIQAVSVETSISHIKPVQAGDIIKAEAVEKSLTHRLGIYEVTLTNQHNWIIALFKGTVFRKDTSWL